MKIRELIESYTPGDEQERKDKEVMMRFIDSFDDVLLRTNGIGHFTSSGFILNPKKDKVLFVYHNIYQSWTWTGGHADGEEDLASVAIKEAKEETGIQDVKLLSENIVSLDVLPVLGHKKRGEYVAAHSHFNVTYFLEADEKQELRIKEDENAGVKWIPINQIQQYSTEKDMYYVYDKLIKRMKKI